MKLILHFNGSWIATDLHRIMFSCSWSAVRIGIWEYASGKLPPKLHVSLAYFANELSCAALLLKSSFQVVLRKVFSLRSSLALNDYVKRHKEQTLIGGQTLLRESRASATSQWLRAEPTDSYLVLAVWVRMLVYVLFWTLTETQPTVGRSAPRV